MFGSGRFSSASSNAANWSGAAVPLGPGGYEALRRDMMAFHDRHEDALADIILHLDDGQAVLANGAIVEARLPALLSAVEPLVEADPALIMDDHARRAGTVQQNCLLAAKSMQGDTLCTRCSLPAPCTCRQDTRHRRSLPMCDQPRTDSRFGT